GLRNRPPRTSWRRRGDRSPARPRCHLLPERPGLQAGAAVEDTDLSGAVFDVWHRMLPSLTGSGLQGVAAQDVEVSGPYAGPAGCQQFGVQGGDPELLEGRVGGRAAAGDLGDDPEDSAGREDAPDPVEEGRLVVDPPVSQAAGDEGVGGVRQGSEVRGGDVQALPG